MSKDLPYYMSRLYTEPAFRQRFFADRAQFYKDEQLAGSSFLKSLEQLSQPQVEFFAKGLLSKRLHAVKQLLPFTFHLLAHDAASLFNAFSHTYLPAGVHKHHEDALAFAGYLKASGMLNKQPEKSLVDFECDLLRNFLHPTAWRITIYHIDPLPLQKAKALPEAPLKPARSYVIWRRGRIRKVLVF